MLCQQSNIVHEKFVKELLEVMIRSLVFAALPPILLLNHVPVHGYLKLTCS